MKSVQHAVVSYQEIELVVAADCGDVVVPVVCCARVVAVRMSGGKEQHWWIRTFYHGRVPHLDAVYASSLTSMTQVAEQ